MKILAIESSAVAASAAVCFDGKLLGEYFTNTARTHSETLLPLCERLLCDLNMNMSDIDGFAVTAGPGSFTGLRIGIATALGFMAATGKGCVPLSTLEVIAAGAADFEGMICAVMDARCAQVYNALFKAEKGVLTRLCEDRAVKIEELAKELEGQKGNIILIGDGAQLCYNTIGGGSKITLASEHVRYQRAGNAALLAESREFLSVGDIRPIYLRLPQAERELAAKLERTIKK